MAYPEGTVDDRIIVLARLVAVEGQLLAHRVYAAPAARIIAQARQELSALRQGRAVPVRPAARPRVQPSRPRWRGSR